MPVQITIITYISKLSTLISTLFSPSFSPLSVSASLNSLLFSSVIAVLTFSSGRSFLPFCLVQDPSPLHTFFFFFFPLFAGPTCHWPSQALWLPSPTPRPSNTHNPLPNCVTSPTSRCQPFRPFASLCQPHANLGLYCLRGHIHASDTLFLQFAARTRGRRGVSGVITRAQPIDLITLREEPRVTRPRRQPSRPPTTIRGTSH